MNALSSPYSVNAMIWMFEWNGLSMIHYRKSGYGNTKGTLLSNALE